MYLWTPDSIRFRIDAADYGGFDAKIAAEVMRHLPKNAHVCDAGCGLGYLSLALSTGCKSVTAVDTNAEALAVLKQNIVHHRAFNIKAVQDNLFDMRPETPYDAMVFCFFGRAKEALLAAKAQCSARVVMVKKNWKNHRFSLEEKPLRGYTLQHTISELIELKVPSDVATFPIEMGQPFRTLDDALLFFQAYAEKTDAEVLPEQILPRLVQTNSERFPYYLPSCKTLGIVTVNTGDIPDSIE
jgi:predicted RNA methylase